MNFSTLIQRALLFWPRIFRRDLKVADPAPSKRFPLMWMFLGLALVGCATNTPSIASVKVSANPQTLESGASTTLSATVSGSGAFSNAVSWSIVSGAGNLSATTGASVTYTATGVAVGSEVVVKATSVGNPSKSDSTTLQVVAAKPKIASFSATPDLLGGGGGNLDLVWEVSGADTLSIDQGVGTVSGTSKTVAVTKDTTFTLTATNAAGSSTASKTVRLTALGDQDWNKQFGTSEYDDAGNIATDGNGNVVIGGSTKGSLAGNNAGSFDALVVKYDPKGNELWKRQYGTGGEDGVSGVATDQSGSVLVTGNTQGALFADNAGASDFYLIKYDLSGNQVWKKQLGSSGVDNVNEIATDSGGNVFVAGYTNGALFADNLGKEDGFLVKYDPAGNLIWKKQFGTNKGDSAGGVATDLAGNVVVVGYTIGEFAGNNAGGLDAIVVKFDANGKELWKRQTGTGLFDSFWSVATDSGGNIVAVAETTNNANNEDVLVIKYDPSGNELWKKQLDTGKLDIPWGVATDSSGNVFVVGYTLGAFVGNNLGGSDFFVFKYDPSGGELWKKQFGTDKNDPGRDAATDSSGNLFIVGSTQGNLFGTNPNSDTLDVFVVRYR